MDGRSGEVESRKPCVIQMVMSGSQESNSNFFYTIELLLLHHCYCALVIPSWNEKFASYFLFYRNPYLKRFWVLRESMDSFKDIKLSKTVSILNLKCFLFSDTNINMTFWG